jgi:hypothetical protein
MDPFLEDLKARTIQLGHQRDRLLAELGLVEAELDRLSTAADVYRAFKRSPADPAAKKPTLVEAIERVLRDRGGFARIPDLYATLIEEGLMKAKNKRSAYNQVYAALHQREDRFREVSGGVWALIDAAQVDRVNAETRSSNGLEAHGVLRAHGSADLGHAEPDDSARREARPMERLIQWRTSAVMPESAKPDPTDN